MATVPTEPVAQNGLHVNTVKNVGDESAENSNDLPPGDLIIVQCYAGSSMAFMKVLIDSGSQTSTITEGALQRTAEKKKMRSTNVRMVSAQGSNFEVKGRVELELQFGKKDYVCDLVVTPVLLPEVDIILGNDFFSKFHTKLFTYPDKEPLFILENQIIPLIKSEIHNSDFQVFNIAQVEEEVIGVARTFHTKSIAPWEEGFLRIRLPNSVNKLKDRKLLFTPFELKYYEDLCFLEGAIRSHQTNKGLNYAYIKYRNYSAYPYELPKKIVLGEVSTFETLNSEDEIKLQQGAYVNTIKSTEDRWSKIQKELLGKVDNPEIQERLLRVFKKHQGTVSLENEILGTTDTIVHKIDYHGPAMNYTPPYPTPKSERHDLSKELKRMLQHRKIEKSESCHNSPVLPIRKKSGELRIVMDFRKINLYTAKLKFPIPRIDDILNDLHGGKVFSCLDMKSGYSQVKLHPESRPLTAFTVPEGRYQYVVLPQGLTNAPSCFQSLMCNVVSGLAPNIFCFLDDLLIVSKTEEEHEKHLSLVLERLTKHNLSIRIDKCEFFKPSVKYLGFSVGSHGIAPLPEKIDAIKDFPRPQDLYQLRSFLGLTSYYRRFLQNYAELSIPLVALTKGHPKKGKRVSIAWNDEAEKSFLLFKEKMCKEVILKFPNYMNNFRVCTDASDQSIGGVLSQLDANGQDRPLCFFSRVLSGAEKKYSTLEKEALGLVYGLRLQKPIIGSFPVEVISDNAPLIYLMKSATANSRVARWQAATLDFDIINFKHLPGKDNVVADAMSRKPFDLVDDLLEELPVMAAIKVNEGEEESLQMYWNVDEIKQEQNKDVLFLAIKRFIKGESAELPRNFSIPLNQFEVQSNILYFKNRSAYGKERYLCCIPVNYRRKALTIAHSSVLGGHAGIDHTVHRLKKFAYWPSMRMDAIAFVKGCEVCKKYKKGKITPIPILRSPQATRPWQSIHVDTVGPLPLSEDGNKYIVTFIDVLTRYGMAAAVRDKSAQSVARAIVEKVFAIFGIAENLVSDNGTEYVNEVLENALKYFKVKHRTVTAYRPSANGLAEQFNKHLLQILKAQVQEDHARWDQGLNLAVFSYNIGYNRTIKDSPFFLLFGRDPIVPYYTILDTPSPWYNIDSYKHELAKVMQSLFTRAQSYIEQGQVAQETYKNKKARRKILKVGDRVYIKRAVKTKMQSHYVGPYRVENINGVIVWVKSIATGKKLRIHSERIILEEETSTSDCKNVRACYPVKIPESDWLENVTKDRIEFENRDELNENVSQVEVELNNQVQERTDSDNDFEGFELSAEIPDRRNNTQNNDFEGFEPRNTSQMNEDNERNDFEGFSQTNEELYLNKEMPVTYTPHSYSTRSKK